MESMQNYSTFASCEDYFGPSASDCSDRFDFTLVFEQSILAIGPAAILLIAAPLRLAHLWPQYRKIVARHDTLNFSKIAAYVVLCALQLALLILWTNTPITTNASIPAAGIGLVNALALCLLSYAEHTRSIKPSTIISLYLAFSILFDAVQCRTLWLLAMGPTLPAVFTASLATKLLLLVLEAQGKRRLLLGAWRHLGPESTSGIIARSLFWWLNGLMMRGFKASLPMSDLYEIDDELRSEKLLSQSHKSWERRRHSGRRALLLTVVESNRTALVLAVVPRLSLMGFTLAQPFLINRVIAYVEGNKGPDPSSYGYGLMAATGLVYVGIALSTGLYRHMSYRAITMIRGSLVSLICFKAVELDAFAVAGSATLTLMSTDVDRICSSFENVHAMWANPIELAIAIWLLERQIGVGCLGPIIVIILSAILTTRLSRYMGPAQKIWIQGIQKRVSVVSSVFGSIKEVKMQGMVQLYARVLQDLRIAELRQSKKFRRLIVYMNLLGNSPASLSPVLAFGIAVAIWGSSVDQSFSIATVFTSLSIMGIVARPMAELLFAVPNFISSLGCFERIQEFLEAFEKSTDKAARVAPANAASTTRTHQDDVELSTVSHVLEPSNGGITFAEDASFSIKAEEPPILRDVNLVVRPSTLTAIIGKVGSGKSVLLQGLLGELHTKGFVKHLATGAAYCAQTVWLVNSTIQKNILGGSPMEERWYEKVINACALDRDFAELPLGDLSLVGSKGLTLSGGQKQRVALARAIYSRKSIFLIDDVLSGLDWATQSHIWDRVFSTTGLLRQHGATVLLATHSLHYLDQTDRIVVLEGGRIAHDGTFSELQNVTSLMTRPDLETVSKDNISTTKGEVSSPERKRVEQTEVNAREEYDLSRASGDTSLYWYYLKSIGWRYSMIGVGLGALFACLTILSQIWLKIWSEKNDENGQPNTGLYFGIFAAISVLGLAAMGVDIWFMFVMIVPKSANNLHKRLLRTTMRAPLSFFSATDTGDLVNRFSQDMSLVDRDLPTAVYMTSSSFFSCIAGAGLILAGAKYMGFILPVATLMLYGLQAFYVRTSHQIRLLDLQAKSPLYTHFLETIDGLATIRAFGWQTATRNSSMKLLDDSQRPYYLLYCIQRWLELVLDLFVAASAFLLVTFMVLLPDTTTASAIAIALYNIISFNSSLANLISSWTSLETSLGAISRLRDFENVTPAETIPPHPIDPPVQWPSRGQLELKNVRASYAAGAELVLNDISLSIRPGEKVAICGRTGSGKSSLLLSLLRLMDLRSGSIELDGIDITRVAPDVLRPRLITVPQEPVLLPGTLRSILTDNYTPAGSDIATEQQITSALLKVELWEALSVHGRLDTEVSEFQLSKGQKQLLYLARAILHKDRSAVLVLDEAMSSVDQSTEDMLVRVLETEFADHTVISVVHRLNTIREFDKVVVLERGSAVEIGKPEELLQQSGSRFRELWERQS